MLERCDYSPTSISETEAAVEVAANNNIRSYKDARSTNSELAHLSSDHSRYVHFLCQNIADSITPGSSTLKTDMLQLSGRLAGDVKESRNDSPTRDLQMAADRTRPHTLCGPVVSSLFSFAARC
jgi:hypothetical protein